MSENLHNTPHLMLPFAYVPFNIVYMIEGGQSLVWVLVKSTNMSCSSV